MSAGPGLGREEAALAARLRRQWPVSGPSEALDQAVLARAGTARGARRRTRARLPWLLASAAAAVLAVGTVLRLAVAPAPTDDILATEAAAPAAPAATPAAARQPVASGGAETAAPERSALRAPAATQPVQAAERQAAGVTAPPSPPADDGGARQAVAVPAAAEAELAAAVALLEAGQDAAAAAAARTLLRRWPGIELPEPLQALLAEPAPVE